MHLNTEQLLEIFSLSDKAIAVYSGKNITIQAVTDEMLAFWHKDRSVVGKTFEDAIPELNGQPFIGQLKQVYQTGESYVGIGVAADLMADGQLQTFYYDYEYRSIKDALGKTYAILHTATDVSEREANRKALALAEELRLAQELALIESEARLLFALNAAEIGTWDLDVINNFVTLDQRCKELFGFLPDDEIVYPDLLKHIHAEDRKKVENCIENAFRPESGGNYTVKFRSIGVHRNDMRWIQCQGKAYFDEDNKPFRFAGVSRDITSEVEGKRRQEQLLGLIENNSEHMSITDMHGRVIYINDAGRALLGVDKQDDDKLSGTDFYRDAELKRVREEVIPVLLLKDRWQGNLELKNNKTQELIPCEVRFILIRDPDTGEAIGCGANARDLRPDIKARRELEQALTELEFLANSIPATVWTSTPEGQVDYVNRRWYDLHNDDAESPMGERWLKNIHPDDVNRVKETWNRSIHTGQPYKVEMRVKENDGFRWYLVQGLPLRGDDGHIRKWYGTNTDIQAQKEAQAQKDNFIGVASHELKTPVTSIKAYAQVIERMIRNQGDQKTAELVGKMDRQINRLNSLIGDLLDVTKINTGRLQFSASEFEFDVLVEEICAEIQTTTEKHKIVCQLNFGRKIKSDRDRLGQVITNLLTNALKYSPSADQIIVQSSLTDNCVQLCVQDFGIGITKEKQAKVFEQFYRVSGTKEHTFPGLGLGLYISSQIIQRMEGKIWVNSIEGQGSTFCFSIPYKNIDG